MAVEARHLISPFLFGVDSYDDTQVLYEWSKVSLKEHDMTEFYVEKQVIRMEPTSFITGEYTLFTIWKLFSVVAEHAIKLTRWSTFDSVLKGVLVGNHSNENEFDLHENALLIFI